MEQPRTLRLENPQSMSEILRSSQVLVREPLSAMIECRQCARRRRASPIPGLCAFCYRRMDFERLPKAEKEVRFVSIVHERYKNATVDTLGASLLEQLRKPPEGESIYLWGAPGTGKTWAFAALARERIENGYLVHREGWERLCLRIRDTFNTRATETEWSVIKPLIDCDTLILEDIGTTTSIGRQETDFSLRVLLVILDSRSEDVRETWITSNKPLEEIEKSFDPRIASRLRQGAIIHKTGKDKRASSALSRDGV